MLISLHFHLSSWFYSVVTSTESRRKLQYIQKDKCERFLYLNIKYMTLHFDQQKYQNLFFIPKIFIFLWSDMFRDLIEKK